MINTSLQFYKNSIFLFFQDAAPQHASRHGPPRARPPTRSAIGCRGTINSRRRGRRDAESDCDCDCESDNES